MSNRTGQVVLSCEEVKVRFPLVPSGSRWRLLFGKSVEAWHDALHEVSLSVPWGTILGVVGRNGAGKSTLLRTMAGVYPLTAGRVIRLGPVTALFELGGTGGFLVTGRDYVMRWLRINGVAQREWDSLIEEIREFSELGDRLDDRLFTYSAGMAARLYFSTATSIGCEIYLIDEVLSVGDEHFQAKCWHRVRERLASGVSGILVTHDWSAILRLCEKACELENGRIVARGEAERIICGYLKISQQLDPDRLAQFSNHCPTSFVGVSGEDWTCKIPIEVMVDGLVFFTYSIEKLSGGKEWQILVIGEEALVATSRGSYLASIEVPDLPLLGGAYRLNLFLTGAKPLDGRPKPSFDIRSWTTGNSIDLIVNGPASAGLVRLPLEVECL